MKTLTAIAMMIMVGALHSTRSHAMTECELLTRIMNKLGTKMSINRYIISTQKDEGLVNKASEELSQQNKSYRDTKRQYKKANCKSIWDR